MAHSTRHALLHMVPKWSSHRTTQTGLNLEMMIQNLWILYYVTIFRLHHGTTYRIDWVAWSVGLSQSWALQKWLNWSRCHLGCGLRWGEGSMGCTLAPSGKYGWTLCVWRRCKLVTNYFGHLLLLLVEPKRLQTSKQYQCHFVGLLDVFWNVQIRMTFNQPEGIGHPKLSEVCCLLESIMVT